MKLFALFFSFYIFVLSLAPNMKGFELLKIGNLIEHYELHKERSPDSTLLGFIKEHYFNADIENEKEHQEMPFKLNTNFVASLFIENKAQIIFEDSPFTEIPSIQKPISKELYYSFSSDYCIWNPPRI